MLARVEIGIVGRTRGTGRAGSAVAAAAYNACARLTDTAGSSYDYSRKRAEHRGGCVLLPRGALPSLGTSEALWQAAEAAERRSDAQLARQLLISVPREVRPDDRLAFASAMIAPYVADGMGAQLDMHCPLAADGGEQPHAHVLLSLRRVTDAGLATTKCREWNKQFREDGGRAERARLSARATAWLAAHGVQGAYDLRNLAARGEDRAPEPTAPRRDWQRWQRTGADPEQAPPAVAEVLVHRGHRAALARAEAEQARAAREAAYLSRRAAGAAAYRACREAWQADFPRPEPRADFRTRHRAERESVFGRTRRGAGRDLALARLDARQSRERVAARRDQLIRQWTAVPRESLDEWIARQAAAGHPAATTVQAARARRKGGLPATPAEAPPPGGEAVRERAAAAVARSDARLADAARSAREARVAARAHARAHSLTGLGWFVFGRRAVAEQTRLQTLVVQAARRASLAERDRREEGAAVSAAAEVAVAAADAARKTWERNRAWVPPSPPPPSLRQPPPSPSRPVDARKAAVEALHAAERAATTPEALSMARRATAAAAAGDEATVTAAVSGDAAATATAAMAWKKRRDAAAEAALAVTREEPGRSPAFRR